ncbi:hypothetical protein [Streptomyces sp. KL116D]|uniref:hypothetical protein n=1 Tax=Streptomyces sp. KL116D TaxID=3045152 RepID=UPI0035570F3A
MTAHRVASLLAPVKGHRMAKAAMEMAVLDAELRASGTSFATALIHQGLGGVRVSVEHHGLRPAAA